MSVPSLAFARPEGLQADRPPESRGVARDEVRLLVTRGDRSSDARFLELPDFLRPGDLLVVNRSATIAASLPAEGRLGPFRLNLSTDYGGGLWLAEPRWDATRPGPLPFVRGEPFRIAEVRGRFATSYPGIPRLWFVRLEGDVVETMARFGSPIRYAYLQETPPLEAYQTIFGTEPGSAEMPSAARPFTRRVVRRLRARGVDLASILLHTGVSSLDARDTEAARLPVYPEPFEVPETTAEVVNRVRCRGGRVIAVGTTVLRALESAAPHGIVRPARGFTQAYLQPGRPIRSVDGLLTGFHDSGTTHLALLSAFAGWDQVATSYRFAAERGYLWHEFGDSQLFLAG